ncbi:MAG: hypothetical protein KKF08_18920 [Gammaproteobacteria bacterium]|nr:hypothetical protein [Gammaproteobacteria bacterium]
MTHEMLAEVKVEVQRLLERIEALENSIKEAETNAKTCNVTNYKKTNLFWYPMETGAIRRASMDLTRALARLRRS